MVIAECLALNVPDSYPEGDTPANLMILAALLKLSIFPISAKIEVPEKCEIPGMLKIGESMEMECSSIFYRSLRSAFQ